MEISKYYITLSIAIITVLGFIVYVWQRQPRTKRNLSTLSGIAFAFIIAGILFGSDRRFGYGFILIGIGLSVIEIVRRIRGNKNNRNENQKPPF